MVAAAVDALGIDLGPPAELARFTFEDQSMITADMGMQLSYVMKRNRERLIWGWKYPTTILSVQSLFFALRNPRMIVVCRDICASIDGEMRFDENNGIVPARRFVDLAQATLNWWTGNLNFIVNTSFPLLIVSYERAIHEPEVFIHQLAAFLGIDLTPEMTREALSRINPHGGYLTVDEQCHPIPYSEPLPELPDANPVDPTV